MARSDNDLSELNRPNPNSETSTKKPQSDDMVSTPATITTKKALNTPEILEKILLRLPALSAFPLQRVNKFWKLLISTSPQLQRNMFLRLPITQSTANTSTVDFEVWKSTRITFEDDTQTIVDMQRMHSTDRSEPKKGEKLCVPVTVNPLLRVVDGTTPLLERMNTLLQVNLLDLSWLGWDEYDVMMCDLPSAILAKPEATLWEMFLTVPACEFQEITIFLRFGDGRTALSTHDYPVMVEMKTHFRTSDFRKTEKLKVRAILEVISEAEYGAWGFVDQQWDTQSDSRVPRRGKSYTPWGFDLLSVAERPIRWRDHDDNSGGTRDHEARAYCDNLISLDTVVGRIKKEYNWTEPQMGPNIKVAIACGRLVDARQDPILLKDPCFESFTALPIVAPDHQDRDRVRDCD